MAQYISFQPSDNFGSKLYSGNGSTQSITGFGFQPDIVWVKKTNGSPVENWGAFSSPRGVTKYLHQNNTDAEATNANSLTSFDADGFSLGLAGFSNGSGADQISWCWKGGTTSGITTNGSTDITPSSYSFNQTAGISVVKFTGNGTSGATIAHGLGAIPEMVLVKNLTGGGAQSWNMYHIAMGNTKWLDINGNSAPGTDVSRWNNTTPDSVNFTVGDAGSVNTSGGTHVAYCFKNTTGFSKMGKYKGNGQNDGQFTYLGFRPKLFIARSIDNSDRQWMVFSSTKGVNGSLGIGYLDSSEVFTSGSVQHHLLSNGYKAKTSASSVNGSNESYLYMAFAEFPFVASNSDPGTAR